MDKKLRASLIKSNKSVWDKSCVSKIVKEGLYEVWFTMVDDLEHHEAYWIRYTLLCPQTKVAIKEGQDLNEYIDNLKGDGMLWFGYFNANDPSKSRMIKKSFPLSTVEGSKEMGTEAYSVVKVQDAEVRLDGIKGGFETTSGKKIAWDLKFSHFMQPYITTPDLAKKLKLTNTLAKATHPNARISGTITVEGKQKELKEVPGVQYHTLGDGYKIPWEWFSCHTFKGVPDAYLDLGSKLQKGVGVVEFFDGKQSITSWNASTLKKLKLMKKIEVKKSMTNLTFKVEFKGTSVQGEISVPQPALLGVQYFGPQGNSYYCYNSEIADCKVKVIIKNPDGTLKEEKEFNAEKSVSFETVYDKPQESVKFLPWEKEEL